MNIDQGLFRLEFADHHAVLGIPIDADPKEARKRYLKIARRLHPDSLLTASDTEKQRASELLSKLVNPAYETLSQEKAATEHAVVLRLRGQQLMRQAETIELSLETARALMISNNIDYAYTTALKALAEKQYENLDEVLAITGQISELNLVYVTRKAGAPAVAPQSAPTQPAATSSKGASGAAPTPATSAPRRYRETILEGYLNRARELEQKQDYAKAIIELREALRAFPNSATCHSRLANVYLKAGQNTMARIHANRALEINAGDEVAQRIQQYLEKTAPAPKGRASTGSDESGDKPRGGLFGLFGGKKK
ncbi:MAG: DnaJ domain-containing protein [Cyanobacteria bacterium Co-bin13]|nr:DnaJ domain-containing protein [Cyanobacteria bacterium Co-bin13]